MATRKLCALQRRLKVKEKVEVVWGAWEELQAPRDGEFTWEVKLAMGSAGMHVPGRVLEEMMAYIQEAACL